jgi:hypothetical protein
MVLANLAVGFPEIMHFVTYKLYWVQESSIWLLLLVMGLGRVNYNLT